jgi:hypothetical protein
MCLCMGAFQFVSVGQRLTVVAAIARRLTANL